jgi:hypothetical protein
VITRLSLLLAPSLLVAAHGAQIPDEIRPYVAFQDNPDRFFEFTQTDAEGVETEGWIFSHWTGQWRVSGEEDVTDLQVVHIRHDAEINNPPVMLGVTISAGPEGMAFRQIRRISLEGGREIDDAPAGSWIFPVPLEVGRTWSTGTEDSFRWSRIEDLSGPNPNPLLEVEECLVKVTVAAERLESGELSVEVEKSHWAQGHGLVWIDQWRGLLDEKDEGTGIEEQAEQVLGRLAELAETAMIQAIPQEGDE